MKYKPYQPKATPENRRINQKSGDATKKVEFKKKSFEFKASTLEECKGVFNQEASFSNPNKSEMFLFIEKISWDPAKTLVNGIIKIAGDYPGGQTEKIYNSKISTQAGDGKRNINLTYTIKEGAEIKVNFECVEIPGENQKYSLLYKWLNPLLAKK
jgi:hypothetical protein